MAGDYKEIEIGKKFVTHAATMNALRNMDVDDLTLSFVNACKKAGEDIAEHHVHSIYF